MERALKLKELIKKYDYQYYELGVSEISDAEYDRIYQEYCELEKQYPELQAMDDSPTKKVGAGTSANTTTTLPKFIHKSPLLSIDQKAKDIESLKDFFFKNGQNEVIVEPKLDGITVNINYEHGKFKNAATRGNGYIGDLITDNFKNTETQYPENIDIDEFELRGEAIIPYSDFAKDLIDDYSNPRNAVAGIMRSVNPEDIKGKHIKVMFYDVGISSEEKSKDIENVSFIKSLGFGSVPTVICKTWEELKSCIETNFNGMIISKNGFNVLNAEGFPDAVCDGLVVKVNDITKRRELGSSQKGPKWAFAFKFKPLQEKTILQDVIWQVGKSGRLTPVAIVNPVSLGGTTITRATLNNYEYMNLPIEGANGTKVLSIGDEIIIERSNDVIPRIIAISTPSSNPSVGEPETCPECGSVIVKNGPLHFCMNNNCPARRLGLIEHFVSRNAMNIVGLGESIIELFHEKGWLNSFADAYSLYEHKDEMLKIEGFGKRKIEKLLKAIEDSKEPELSNFIYALSISNIGRKTAKDLAVKYQTIDNFLKCTKDELLTIEDFGEVMADAVIEWIAKNDISDLIETVKPKRVSASGDKFTGLSFVITGTLENPREYYQKMIEDNGGKVSNSVSKKTYAVLIGTNAGSKEAKARELVEKGFPIKILDTNELINEFFQG